MPQDPFPEPGPDGEEPASSPLPPAAEDGPGPDDWDGSAEQGLYVCLPAEQVTLADCCPLPLGWHDMQP